MIVNKENTTGRFNAKVACFCDWIALITFVDKGDIS